ncbi:DUF2490 domain-containing protein [Parvicella tangerina]|uniref:DUF2490 domain-containing protein n=1 Tax=Parvicella tangerina TaxID=2829795 RepID=A0A916JLM4_9FLAO|nr:DUF2490 domain-containing protein [Parvicella tangerina]CAG5079566.1 hypothetical protein CRYO30217_00977 [Parvicella tangerina]
MKQIKYIMILLFAFSCVEIFAQDGEWVTIRDFETWNSFNLKYKLNKNWKLGLEQQFRFNDNSSALDRYFTELSVSHSFSKYIFGGVGFRYLRQNDTKGDVQGFENHLRFNFDFGVKHSLNRFDFKYRLRFQTKNELGISKDEGDYSNNHIRLKAGVGYNIKKWKLDPEGSVEIFRHYEKGEQNGFNNIRFTFGTKYNLKKIGVFGLFYRFEKELNAQYPLSSHIIGFKYTYTLKKKKK